MKLRRKLAFGVVALGLGSGLAGCIPFLATIFPIEFVWFLVLTGGGDPRAEFEGEETMDVAVRAGGLDGTFDVDFGAWGSTSGMTPVLNQRFTRLRWNDNDEVESIFTPFIVSSGSLSAIDITKSKLKVDAYQTPGGIELIYKGQLKVQGTVVWSSKGGEPSPRKFKAKMKIPQRRIPRPGTSN